MAYEDPTNGLILRFFPLFDPPLLHYSPRMYINSFWWCIDRRMIIFYKLKKYSVVCNKSWLFPHNLQKDLRGPKNKCFNLKLLNVFPKLHRKCYWAGGFRRSSILSEIIQFNYSPPFFLSLWMLHLFWEVTYVPMYHKKGVTSIDQFNPLPYGYCNF